MPQRKPLGRSLVVRVCLLVATAWGVAACEPDPGTNPGDTKQWEFVFQGLDPVLLSVWGSAADDVFVVGSDPGDGGGPWVLHWDGAAWARLATGQRGTLWWVAGTDRAGPVYLVGESGLALRYDRGSGQFTRLTGVASSVTLFGVFPLGTAVWAVGGDAATNHGYVYALSANQFAEVGDVPAAVAAGGMFFKIWGRAADDLWVVGGGDKVLHKTAGGWQSYPSPGGRRLVTVHGNSAITVAVGGYISGVVAELSDAGVADATPDRLPQLDGVWVKPDGTVIAVGDQGAVWERSGNQWSESQGVPPTILEYHAVYVDPSGGVWAVGGYVLEPQRQGMLLHYGDPISGTLPP